MYNNKQWTIVVVVAAVALTGWLIAGCGGGGGTEPASTGSVSGSTVIMDTVPPEPAGGVTITVGGQQSVSDVGDGSFTVTGVPPGLWEVVATSGLWQQAVDPPEVVVVAGQTTVLSAPILMTNYGPPPPPVP